MVYQTEHAATWAKHKQFIYFKEIKADTSY